MLLYKALQLLGAMTGLKITVIKTEEETRRNQDKPAVSLTEESLYIRLHVSKLHFGMSKEAGEDRVRSQLCGSFTEIRLILVAWEDQPIPDQMCSVC